MIAYIFLALEYFCSNPCFHSDNLLRALALQIPKLFFSFSCCQVAAEKVQLHSWWVGGGVSSALGYFVAISVLNLSIVYTGCGVDPEPSANWGG